MINWAMIDDFFKSIHFDIELLKPFEKIYVLVSGGHDSTLLAEWICHHYPDTTYFVNCYNPYETSPTLSDFETRGLIVVKPDTQYNYSQILKDAFLKLNKAAEMRHEKKYEKKIFECCKYIKHKAFLEDSLFKEENTVVISGIKSGDGKIRRFFLKDLRNPPLHHNYASEIKQGFFHRHKGGQLYCYPLRDCFHHEFPNNIISEIKKIHPKLQHSGCAICPVLLLFGDRIKKDKEGLIRFNRSVKYCQQLIKKGEFIPSALLLKYCVELGNTTLMP
jgi:hypothetical protein